MTTPDYTSTLDAHLDPIVAAAYDQSSSIHFAPEVIEATVAFLADLASDGPAVEFAVGTGRLAVPLSKCVSPMYGLDFSEPMLDQLRNKDGSERVAVTYGDMTTTRVCDDASLVYLVYNTIQNLRTQQQQVECFANAAAHLAPGGAFVLETMVPELHQLPAGETFIPFDVSPTHLGFSEYVDLLGQISVSHHYHIDGDRVRVNSPSFRYVWPSELDLMAQLAGLRPEAKWADWDRSPFTGESPSLVGVWRKP